MYCTDISKREEQNDDWKEESRLRTDWNWLSGAVMIQITVWYLAAFGRMILLNWLTIKGLSAEKDPFHGWNASDVVKCVSFVTGAILVIMTIKLSALLICRANWLKRKRRDTGLQIVRRNPLRWFWMIPAQCLLDILLFGWALYIQDLHWIEQLEQGPVEGHPGPLLLIAAMFCAVWLTLGAAVAACVCACVSRYREKRWKGCK
ncbi:MAG: hypothetical protein NC305_08870 [Lachnospiraceae bacterium]|nr:hypothetical protein [Butyrivibrio sp.]MCM1344596.1 hypothetical protein [Muribaculaceae bacterium]MCM1410645.1 hypothetical protein [Lachnospiraceae bacterium]